MNKRSIFRQIMIIITLCTLTVFMLISLLSTLVYRNIAAQTLLETNDHILSQLDNSYEMLYRQIIDIIAQLSADSNVKAHMTSIPADVFEHYQMQRYMNDYLQTFSSFTGLNAIDIILCGQNGQMYFSNDQVDAALVRQMLKEPFVLETGGDYRKLGFVPAHTGVTAVTRDKYASVIAKGMYNTDLHRFFGTLLLMIDESCFSAHYRKLEQNSNLFALVSEEGVVLSASDSTLNHQLRPDLLAFALEPSEQVSYQNRQYTVQSKHNTYFRFYTVLLSDRSLISARMRLPMTLSIGVCALVLFLEGMLVSAYVRRITHPITALARVMNGSIRENITRPPKLKGKFASCAEAEELTAAYEHMSHELKTYISDLVDEHEARRVAEMNALQYQINPHFLYNTLASIKYLALTQQKEAVQAAINALIQLLRRTLGDVRSLIPLKEEIAITECSFAIQNLRYNDRIRLSVHTSDGCEMLLVPKLILQPIVENAIFHAFSEKMEDCSVDLFFSRTQSLLSIELIDNGQGIPAQRLQDILCEMKSSNKSGLSGIGLYNVQERIRLLYGEGYGIKVTSAVGCGTQVKLTLPCMKEAKEASGDETAHPDHDCG